MATHEGKPLTEDDFDALPDGARVVVTWSGGNGPHEYLVRVSQFGQRLIVTDCEAVIGHYFGEASVVTTSPASEFELRFTAEDEVVATWWAHAVSVRIGMPPVSFPSPPAWARKVFEYHLAEMRWLETELAKIEDGLGLEPGRSASSRRLRAALAPLPGLMGLVAQDTRAELGELAVQLRRLDDGRTPW